MPYTYRRKRKNYLIPNEIAKASKIYHPDKMVIIGDVINNRVRNLITPRGVFEQGLACCSDCGKLQSRDNYKCSNCDEKTFWVVQ